MTSSGDSAPEEQGPGCVRDPGPAEGPHRTLEATEKAELFLPGRAGAAEDRMGNCQRRVGCIRSGAPEGPGLFIWEVRSV